MFSERPTNRMFESLLFKVNRINGIIKMMYMRKRVKDKTKR